MRPYGATARICAPSSRSTATRSLTPVRRSLRRTSFVHLTHRDSVSAKAIDLDPRYAKAYFRRATCYLQTLKPKLAVADLKKVLALEPGNATVKTQLESTQKLVRRTEFEKAIEVGEEKTPVETCGELIAGGKCNCDFFFLPPSSFCSLLSFLGKKRCM
jgi:hypothetical protein